MPSKEDNSAAPAAAAVVAGTGEAPTANQTATASAAQRRDREEPAEEQRVVRARQEVAEVREWEWSSPVSDILLHRINPVVEKMGLREFVREYVRRDYPIEEKDNYTMNVVVANPNGLIPEEVRKDIEPLEAFQLLRNAHHAMKDAYLLNKRGIVSLGQWKSTVNRDALNISAFTKGILDNAISVAEQTDNLLRQQEETRQLKEKLEKVERLLQANVTVLDGLYESIYGAKWDYVFNNPKGDPDRFWLEVKKDNSPPPQEWTDEEVDYFKRNVSKATITRIRTAREEELKEDAKNVKPTRERLQMKVLTSTQGWPYRDPDEEIFDCYITKEVERAWRFIQDDLHEWFDEPSRSKKKPRKRIVIGTPGIGKSMAAGSYLLYQLLHYNVERLPVVAYFIGRLTYIFDKTNEGKVTMYDDVIGLDKVMTLSQNCKGYIIFDCSKKVGEPPLELPDTWGTTVISSPDENNFKAWAEHRSSTDIVINCPTTADLKAMYMWKQRNNNKTTEEILSEWAVIKERAETLGPLPRFVFNAMQSEKREEMVKRAIDIINATSADQYVGVSSETWATISPCHKLAMILRRSTSILYRMDYHRNASLSGKIKCDVIQRLAILLQNNKFLKTALFNANHAACVALENYGCGVFKNKDFVKAAGKEIKRLKKETTDRERSCILQEDLEATPTEETKTAYSVRHLRKFKTKMTIEFKKLYIPESQYFPLVDAFFFARSSGGKTILVGLQTTTAGRHPTKTGTVCQFIDYLSNFDKWTDYSTDLVMEIIYVQSQGVNQIDEWQECPKVLGKRYSAQQHEEAENFWNERVFQYHLCLSDNLK